MSKGHHHYKRAVSISYDARGVYMLKCPTGTWFPSFEAVFGEFYRYSHHEGTGYSRWGFGCTRMSNGDYDFDLVRDRVMLRTRNLHPSLADPAFRARSLHGVFADEIVFRDDCGRRISAYHVLANLSRICDESEVERPKVRVHRGRQYYERYRDADFRKAPVGCTGRRRRYNWDRSRPAVTREIAENEFLAYDEDMEDLDIKIRSNRCSRKLAEHRNWDYPRRSDWRDRNWKRHRDHQWKP
jgi:hypothetical protein